MINYIKYYKWDKNHNSKFINSCKKYLNIDHPQIYMPFFSLYFYIHNTKNANKIIDLLRRYYIHDILKINDNSYYNSNKFINCDIYDSLNKSIINKDIFIKCIPILDPLHTIMNNYKLDNLINLPSNYIYNTQNKINNFNNSCYIEVFLSYLTYLIYQNNELPFFPMYYGSINGISNNFKIDISSEYREFCDEKWFSKYINNLFTIDLYVSNSDTESDSDTESNDDFICNINKIPVQYIFMEKLEGTMEDFLKDNINYDLIKSCLFQIIFILLYLQKKLKFTHNDLHINNIMYKKTNITYLYYKYNNSYFKIPTYGYIFTIIDFGRSIFQYKNKIFYNDVFSKYGEAEGQYTYPIPNINMYIEKYIDNKEIYPNYSFDMCRLSITILEELDTYKNYNSELINFLNLIVTDCNNNNLYINREDSFDLYINIAKLSCNGLPHNLILNKYFNDFKINKKVFPPNNYYKS